VKTEYERQTTLFVRVKLLENSKLSFTVNGVAVIKDSRGNRIELKNKSFKLLSSRKYKGETLYYPVILSTQNRSDADEFIRAFRREGYILKKKKRVIGKLTPIYIVYAGPFENLKEMNSKAPPNAVRVIKSRGSCRSVPVYFVINGNRYTLYGRIRIQNRGKIKLNDVETSGGLYKRKAKCINLTSNLSIIPADSKLSVIANVPIEEYVTGVVKSEIGENAPLEAKKAQAVAARTNVIRKLWRGTGFEDYDITSSVFAQVYTGEGFSDGTRRAVAETAGEILVYKGEPIEALFHAMCGGHTENSENVWSSYVPYLRGVFDRGAGHKRFSLKSERAVKKWLEQDPDVNCRKYGKKYWRWRYIYTPRELANILKAKTGRDIGIVLEIKVLERGVSGRVKKIRIVGSRGEIVIRKDLEIRKAFLSTSLPSSLFYVEKRGGKFIITGRGFGHGVGMCQIGAMGMADKGYNYRKILKHYYSHVRLEKIY